MKNKKGLILLTIIALMVVGVTGVFTSQGEADQSSQLTNSAVFALGVDKYYLDNKAPVAMDAKPFAEQGRTFVPIRYLSNALGVTDQHIGWASPKVTLDEPGFPIVELSVGSTQLKANGKAVSMDVAPLARDGRTYLPARFVAEALGYEVGWDAANNIVICWPKGKDKPDISGVVAQIKTQAPAVPVKPPTKPSTLGTLKVHFIDVGQGDSILIQTHSGQAALIDGGIGASGQTVVNYIKAQGITKLDAVIATHPHEDHIGGLVTVIKAFPVSSFYMPNKAHTTKTFENLVNAVNQSNAKRIQAKAGVKFDLGDVKAEFVAPNSSSYDNLNDYSAVLKITHGQNSFLLTGDAERVSEQEMINSGYSLKATALKVAHHGSNSSTTDSFLKAVSPKYAVISAGKDNSYGHPHQEVLTRLQGAGVEIYRTDDSGTVIATSDGQIITFNIKASPIKPHAPPAQSVTQPTPVIDKPVQTAPVQDVTVYITKTGTKYHLDGCRSLSKSKISIKLSEARGKYGPCSVCNPPR